MPHISPTPRVRVKMVGNAHPTRLGFEVKLTSSPHVTPSMRSALSDLKLQRLYVIHSGEETFQLARKIQAVALPRLLEDLKPLR